MNKKKLINGVLIVILVFIWASVFIKIFIKETPESGSNFISNMDSGIVYSNYLVKDSFEFKISERDPFNADKKRRTQPVISSTRTPAKRTATKPTINVTWPTIKYYGFVKSDKSTSKLVLLKVDNRLYRKREKERINELTVQKAFSDSVVVSINDNYRTFKKENE